MSKHKQRDSATTTKVNLESLSLILTYCTTLTEAETKLTGLIPMPSKAFRWGAWDGWSDREKTTSGLFSAHEADSKKARELCEEYMEGWEVGRQARDKYNHNAAV